MKILQVVLLLFVIAGLVVLPQAQGQSSADPGTSSSTALSATATNSQAPLAYTRPTRKTKFVHYVFDTVGPYPILGAALAAGINQWDNSPPEWRQGGDAYAQRFGSAFGIAAVSTTTRYALAGALGEDTLYYRCECKGVFPRFSHAVLSTFIARRGDDGHRVFSIPGLVAPYAGTMTAVYAWYPDRYDAKDAFRMGNYSLLWYIGGNVAQEFLFGGRHSVLTRLHLKPGHEAPAPDAKP